MPFENLESIMIFGSRLFDFNNLGEMTLKFTINLTALLIIVRFIFYPIYREGNYMFTTILINISIFLICILLSSIKLKIGFAFGLFAVFSIIRYRTEQIPIREMTYLFVVIIVAVINAISNHKVSYAELLMANSVIVLAVLMLEKNYLHQCDVVKTIKYERIELIKPDNYNELIEDLSERTGFDIIKAEVGDINFLNDTAMIKIFYRKDRKTRLSAAEQNLKSK